MLTRTLIDGDASSSTKIIIFQKPTSQSAYYIAMSCHNNGCECFHTITITFRLHYCIATSCKKNGNEQNTHVHIKDMCYTETYSVYGKHCWNNEFTSRNVSRLRESLYYMAFYKFYFWFSHVLRSYKMLTRTLIGSDAFSSMEIRVFRTSTF